MVPSTLDRELMRQTTERLLSQIPDLEKDLRGLLRQIPRGRVSTYGHLATALGDRTAARWVAQYLLDHRHGPRCRCHRVVRITGELGSYIEGDVSQKQALLEQEGVTVHGGVVDVARYGVQQFESNHPLARLQAIQKRLLKRHSLEAPSAMPRLIAGVDISYVSPQRGVAAYVLFDVARKEVVWSTTLCRRVRFPYVSGYLSFRELPLLLELFQRVHAAGRMAGVVLVDGSGILHPRGAGVATHLGILADWPTIGVTKTLLHGSLQEQPSEQTPVVAMHNGGRSLGWAVRPVPSRDALIYISPGYGTDVDFARRAVMPTLFGRKLPEPIYWADRLSREEARRLKRKTEGSWLP